MAAPSRASVSEARLVINTPGWVVNGKEVDLGQVRTSLLSSRGVTRHPFSANPGSRPGEGT